MQCHGWDSETASLNLKYSQISMAYQCWLHMQSFIFSNFVIKAAKNDTIGLKITVSLLTKVLAAASAIEAEQVTVRWCT